MITPDGRSWTRAHRWVWASKDGRLVAAGPGLGRAAADGWEFRRVEAWYTEGGDVSVGWPPK